MRIVLALTALVIAGCSKAPTTNEAKFAKSVLEARQRSVKSSENADKSKATDKGQRKDRDAIVQ
jgi:hypothetical protein